MVAPQKTRRIVCTVVRSTEPALNAERFSTRPSTLLPWADPYIAGLVRRLQSEVRFERAAADPAQPSQPSPVAAATIPAPVANRITGSLQNLQAELEPPSPAFDFDWDWRDEPRWSFDGDGPEGSASLE